ncbi:GlxA family transcriptional regulator [Filimonas effusa]|uniref:GlxA family transcriptional regulator n=1 Tax=Filimonas effusa TaxID=2508721 RepID=A0A4Q1D9K6_9BACT|nr:GlxA family transcriptional regulator [Filimonas effusa]RXK86031.1 GlxA family transcriptional regulator [Filimonas effusa]
MKHIVIIVPPMTSILDVAGPLEVFTRTAAYISSDMPSIKQSYAAHVLSVDGASIVTTSSGLPIVCEGGLSSINYPVDTVLIAGRGSYTIEIPVKLLEWLKKRANKIRRIGSICAGAFILAEAGLLNGRRATTHWQVYDKMAKLYPQVKVERDPIYVKDGNIYTSAGISTGIDLSLALVEEDFGRDVAVAIARLLVLYLKRPGNQSQFSNILMHQAVDYKPIQEIQEWIMMHLDKDLGVEALAGQAAMSPRNFARVFLKETGVTPAKYVEKVRLETARQQLEETHLTMDDIASDCGLGSADNLRRLFLRHLKITPSEYRRSFASALV